MLEFKCEETRSGWIENKGSFVFEFHPFPLPAQIAPVNATSFLDVSGDGNPDITIAGNEYQAEVHTGSYNASYGLILLGNGKGSFIPQAPAKNRLVLDADVKDISIIGDRANGKIILFAINDERLRAFKILGSAK